MLQQFTLETIQSWDRLYRMNFINCLSGYKSLHLVGTVDQEQNENLSLFSNIVHLGADPALIGLVNRPSAATPHTLSNIASTGVFSLNHVQPSILEKAHQTSAKYPKEISEFDAVGLQSMYRTPYICPFVADSKIQYACKLKEIIPISHNNTHFIIAEIVDVWLPQTIVKEDGYLDLEALPTLTSLGLDAYFEPKLIKRIPYARVN